MWYQFENGVCVSSSTGKVAPMDGVVSIWCDEVYSDIQNLRLVNGKVIHVGGIS